MDARNQPQGQAGSGAVEMALLLPVVLLLFFGIIDFSRFFYLRACLTSAVADAARVASLPGSADADIKAVITTALADPVSQGSDAKDVSVTVEPGTRLSGDMVVVSAGLPYSPLFLPRLLGGSVFSDTITAKATTVVE